jgi:hypothetical protein
MLGANPDRHQLWVAVGILHGFDCVFRREPSHYQGQLAIGCRLDRKSVDAQDVLRSVSTATVYFHYKLDVFHDSFQILGQGFGLSVAGTGIRSA